MTAEEFLESKDENYEKIGDVFFIESVMIEFAQYHVKLALQNAIGEAPLHCTEGIKNCYPKENIK